MEVCLKMVHYLALVIALGSPVWWLVVWKPACGSGTDAVSQRLWQRLRTSLLLAAGLFVLSGLADALRAAAQILALHDFNALWLFFTASRYGQMALYKSCLLPLSVTSFLLGNVLPKWLSIGSMGLSSLLTLVALSLTSHAATQPGILPVLSDLSHLCGALVWGGGLLAWAHVPWSLLAKDLRDHMAPLAQAIERFSLLAFGAVVLLAATGVIAAFLHIYGAPALTQTPYGRTVAGKIALFAGALGLASYHVLVLSPACHRQVRRFVPETAARLLRSLAWLVRLEALSVTGAILLAGLLTTLPPAERPGAITATEWTRPLGAWQMRLNMSPMVDPGQVRLSVALQPQQGDTIPDNTPVLLHMRMPDHAMSSGLQAALPGADGLYTASAVVSMAGRWQIEVTAQPPQRAALSTTVDFEAVTGARDRDRQRRLEFAAVLISPVHAISCLLGILLGLLAVVVVWGAYVGRMPRWTLIGAVGMLACGAYLIFSIVLVDAYPTTYVKNPVPGTPAAVVHGQQVFQSHCVTCHGSDGRGQGPAAAALSPPPSDLTARHLDDHTDGELFWWITHGMPGTAMPAWEGILGETQRWQLIHHLRAIRRQTREGGNRSS